MVIIDRQKLAELYDNNIKNKLRWLEPLALITIIEGFRLLITAEYIEPKYYWLEVFLIFGVMLYVKMRKKQMVAKFQYEMLLMGGTPAKGRWDKNGEE